MLMHSETKRYPTQPYEANDPRNRPRPAYGHETDPALLPEPLHRKVLMISHNPVLKTEGGKTLRDYFNWYDPDDLADACVDDMRWSTYGYADYEIVERIVVDGYPVKRDGFRYTEASYLNAWRTRQFHPADGVDYLKLVEEFDMIPRIDRGEIDEIWLFGHPYGGYYESIMGGPGAFFCNAPALAGTEHAKRRFVIMGFNFERGVGEMLEDFGHRAESILHHLYENEPKDNLWTRFYKCGKDYPGEVTECGNVHFSPNSVRDYDWGNRTVVMSRCDNWYNYPDLRGEPRPVDCSEWGDGQIRLHHLWWFRHFPHITGTAANGFAHNWWQYIIDPNTVP
jgi:broad specificity phosphatase PhoE